MEGNAKKGNYTDDDFENSKLSKTVMGEQKQSFEYKTGKSGEEQRAKVSPLPKDQLHFSLGQLRFVKKGEKFIGTGTMIAGKFKKFVVTCAHNFVDVFANSEVVEEKEVWLESGEFHYQRNGNNKNEQPYTIMNLENVFVYPGYTTTPDLDKGFDFAIGQLEEEVENKNEKWNLIWDTVDNLDVKPGETLYVVGYPGEYNPLVYSMKGTVKEIKSVGKEKKNKVIIYENIDTSCGQSGSPVVLERNGIYYGIGVHVGRPTGVNFNVGTAITTEVAKWMCKILAGESES